MARAMEKRMIVTIQRTVFSSQPVRKVSEVAALAAHPGNAFGKIAPRTTIR
jgi:hypothetical protein